MTDDEDQREEQRQKGSNSKPVSHKKWRKRSQRSSHDQAVEFVDRLEHALRNLFK